MYYLFIANMKKEWIFKIIYCIMIGEQLKSELIQFDISAVEKKLYITSDNT